MADQQEAKTAQNAKINLDDLSAIDEAATVHLSPLNGQTEGAEGAPADEAPTPGEIQPLPKVRARGASIHAQPIDILSSHWSEQDIAPEFSSDCSDYIWTAIKFILLPVFIIPFLPLLTTDLYMGKLFDTHKIAMSWYFMDKGDITRRFWRDTIGQSFWFIPVVIQAGEYVLIWIVLGWLYDREGGPTPKLLRAVQGLFLGGFVLVFILLMGFSIGSNRATSICHPARDARWGLVTNWIPILSTVYDFFALNSIVVRPQVLAPITVPFLEDFLYSEYWTTFWVRKEIIMYCVAMALAWCWVVLNLHVYIKLDVQWHEKYVFSSKIIGHLFPLLTQTLFLFISVNLLQGLKQETDHWIQALSHDMQWFVMSLSLVTLLVYGASSLFYWGWLNGRTDDYFIARGDDFRSINLYSLIERLCKLTLATMNIFLASFKFQVLENLTASNSVSIFICFSLFLTNVWVQPCSVRAMNFFKAQTYFMISWSCVSSLIAIHLFGDPDPNTLVSDTWIPAIILGVGWGASAIYSVTHYVSTVDKRIPLEGQLYTWGFRPDSRQAAKWTRASRPKQVFLPEKIRVSNSEIGRTSFIFAISQSGGVYSAGKNDRGQLGHGDLTYRFTLKPVTSLWIKGIMAKQLSLGGEHVLLLTLAGYVYSWGRGDQGQLGHGDLRDVLGPKRVYFVGADGKTEKKNVDGSDIKARLVAANRFSSTIVAEPDGDIYSFGLNTKGQLGLGCSFDTMNQEEKKQDWDQHLVKGFGKDLRIYIPDNRWYMTEHDLFCTRPTLLADVEQLEVIGADGGADHTCFWTNTGDLYVMGSNEHGQLGLGEDVKHVYNPTRLPLAGPAVQMSCGEEFTMLLLENGDVYVMGKGSDGQLGLGPDGLKGRFLPTKVEYFSGLRQAGQAYVGKTSDHKICSINAGSYHAAAISEKGQVFVWGQGEQCQLGTGEARRELYPYPLAQRHFGNEKIVRVDLGKDNTIFQTEKGKLYMSGTGVGEVGLGTRLSHDCFVSLPTNLFYQASSEGKEVEEEQSVIPTPTKNYTKLNKNKSDSPDITREPTSTGSITRGLSTEADERARAMSLEPDERRTLIQAPSTPSGAQDPLLLNSVRSSEVEAPGIQQSPDKELTKVATTDEKAMVAFSQESPPSLLEIKNSQVEAARRIQRIYRQHLIKQERHPEVFQLGADPKGLHQSPGTLPFPAEGAGAIKQVSLARDHGGILSQEGKLYMFGSNGRSQLGLAEEVYAGMDRNEKRRMKQRARYAMHWTARPLPSPVPDVAVQQVACGNRYTLILLNDGTAWSFGSGVWGQLGHFSFKIDRRSDMTSPGYSVHPRQVQGFPAGVRLTRVMAAHFHSGAIDSEGNAWTWGNDGKAVDSWFDFQLPKAYGILGQGDELSGLTCLEPRRLEFPKAFIDKGDKAVDMQAGLGHTLVLTEKKDVYAFGFGYFGALGLGTDHRNVTKPTHISLPGPARALAVGFMHSVVVVKGDAYSWGDGSHGVLGHGDETTQSTPKLVAYLKKRNCLVKDVKAGTYQTVFCIKESGGQLWITGSWVLGALGAGEVHHSLLTPRVMGSLLGRKNKGVACGNHFLAAW